MYSIAFIYMDNGGVPWPVWSSPEFITPSCSQCPCSYWPCYSGIILMLGPRLEVASTQKWSMLWQRTRVLSRLRTRMVHSVSMSMWSF